jgi:hypothetical protein
MNEFPHPMPYDGFINNVNTMADRAHRPGARGVLSPDDVAKVAVKAITSRRPKTRYRLGPQARLAPLVRRLTPDRLWDAIMLRMAPFPVE